MLEQKLLSKILILSEEAWEGRLKRVHIDQWLANFTGEKERLHALHLLSQFIYFGSSATRELLQSLYRDLFRYPLIEKIRRAHSNTTDTDLITRLYREELAATRFLGVGNPSESGSHLLYFFRQENGLSKGLFINSFEIFSRDPDRKTITLKSDRIKRYVFIDDLCGSGDQAKSYSQEIVEVVKSCNPDIDVIYLVLFATQTGMNEVRKTTFTQTGCVVELDESFRAFGSASRYYESCTAEIDKDFARNMCKAYGKLLVPGHPLGYRDSQLMVGFHHNTPDNTLPIMWCDNPDSGEWTPIFKRYRKF